MDEKEFKRHLRDLAHGKHNPAEHDWAITSSRQARPARHAKKQTKRRTK